jgi:hypothetical protein
VLFVTFSVKVRKRRVETILVRWILFSSILHNAISPAAPGEQPKSHLDPGNPVSFSGVSLDFGIAVASPFALPGARIAVRNIFRTKPVMVAINSEKNSVFLLYPKFLLVF